MWADAELTWVSSRDAELDMTWADHIAWMLN